MPYYPDQTLILGNTKIIKEYKLPPNALGEVLAQENRDVTPDTVLLEGSIPMGVIMVDALKVLGLRYPEQITEEMYSVLPGELVDPDTPILTLPGRRGKTVYSPVRAIFSKVESGRVVLQTDPQPIQIKALLNGRVTVASERRVVVETTGSLIQGAWGNGHANWGNLELEPEGGLMMLKDNLLGDESTDKIVVLSEPILSHELFEEAGNVGVRGLIAGSMPAILRDWALAQSFPVLLTEGFGEAPMSEIVYNLLRNNVSKPAMVDAVQPDAWVSARPEIIVPNPVINPRVRPPERELPLQPGAVVRLTRAPHAGKVGRVVRLPETPMTLEHGLRLAVAEVQLSEMETIFAPLANIELLGRPLEAAGKL